MIRKIPSENRWHFEFLPCGGFCVHASLALVTRGREGFSMRNGASAVKTAASMAGVRMADGAEPESGSVASVSLTATSMPTPATPPPAHFPFLKGAPANDNVEWRRGLQVIEGGGKAATSSGSRLLRFLSPGLRFLGGGAGVLLSGILTPNDGSSWHPGQDLSGLPNPLWTPFSPAEILTCRFLVMQALHQMTAERNAFLAKREYLNAQRYNGPLEELQRRLGDFPVPPTPPMREELRGELERHRADIRRRKFNGEDVPGWLSRLVQDLERQLLQSAPSENEPVGADSSPPSTVGVQDATQGPSGSVVPPSEREPLTIQALVQNALARHDIMALQRFAREGRIPDLPGSSKTPIWYILHYITEHRYLNSAGPSPEHGSSPDMEGMWQQGLGTPNKRFRNAMEVLAILVRRGNCQAALAVYELPLNFIEPKLNEYEHLRQQAAIIIIDAILSPPAEGVSVTIMGQASVLLAQHRVFQRVFWNRTHIWERKHQIQDPFKDPSPLLGWLMAKGNHSLQVAVLYEALLVSDMMACLKNGPDPLIQTTERVIISLVTLAREGVVFGNDTAPVRMTPVEILRKHFERIWRERSTGNHPLPADDNVFLTTIMPTLRGLFALAREGNNEARQAMASFYSLIENNTGAFMGLAARVTRELVLELDMMFGVTVPLAAPRLVRPLILHIVAEIDRTYGALPRASQPVPTPPATSYAVPADHMDKYLDGLGDPVRRGEGLVLMPENSEGGAPAWNRERMLFNGEPELLPGPGVETTSETVPPHPETGYATISRLLGISEGEVDRFLDQLVEKGSSEIGRRRVLLKLTEQLNNPEKWDEFLETLREMARRGNSHAENYLYCYPKPPPSSLEID